MICTDGTLADGMRKPRVRLDPVSHRRYLACVSEATVRELRNQGGRALDRVLAGERVTITRDGKPVARLVPVGRDRLSATSLVERFRPLPAVDAGRLRADIDSIIDQAL